MLFSLYGSSGYSSKYGMSGLGKLSGGMINPLPGFVVDEMKTETAVGKKTPLSDIVFSCSERGLIDGHQNSIDKNTVIPSVAEFVKYENGVYSLWKMASGNTPESFMRNLTDSEITRKANKLLNPTGGVKNGVAGYPLYANLVQINGNTTYWYLVCTKATEPYKDTSSTNTTTNRPQRDEDCDKYCQTVERERTMYLSENNTTGSIPIRVVESEVVCNPPDREVTVPCADGTTPSTTTNSGTSTTAPKSMAGIGRKRSEWR